MAQQKHVDTVLWIAAAGSWALTAAAPSEAVRLGSIGLASALTTLALFRPRSRRQEAKAIADATATTARELQQAAASSAQHVARWRAILDTATEGIITIDTRGCIQMLNDAAQEMFGYASSELVGKNVKVLMPDPYRGEHDDYLTRYLTTGIKRIIGVGREVAAQRKDGSIFPIDLSVGEGRTEDTHFFTALVRDISERKELQAKLAQAERLAAVGELSAGVAHEINNPINTIINCAQLIVDGDEPIEHAQMILQEGDRITGIVQALLQFARDDRDSAEPTSLREVIARTRQLIDENWTRNGISLSVELPDSLPNVRARTQRLQQVLLNLLMNAKDAVMQKPTGQRNVAIRTATEDDGVLLEVRDSGAGVDPSVAERIFEPFITTKRARGGTGLGLSVSKSIVEDYGGRLHLAETAPEGGACFSVWLPLDTPETAG
ncbi:MAG: nitrogen regulation protein NR(II) [Planctomycetota bacterium]